MKSLPSLEVGQRGIIAPKELSLHSLTLHQPWMPASRFEGFAERLREDGVREELLITPDREIANGRHRWKAMSVRPHLTQACLPYRVVAEEDVADIIMETTLERRHMSLSARAFMALDLVEHAVQQAAANSASQGAANLTKGSRPIQSGVLGKGLSPMQQLARRLGVSDDYLTMARKTEKLFKDSDARREKWLNENPEASEAWDERDTEKQPDWQTWRAAYLIELGVKDAPDSAAAAAVIPEDYRAIYTARLFSERDPDDDDGPMSLGAINKAVGSALSTKGGTRSDVDKKNPALHITLGNKLTSFSKTMFGKWSDLEAGLRIGLATKVADAAAQWPDEVKAAVAAKLKGGAK